VDEPRLTVSGAARRLGIAPATLRTWDRRYGVGPGEHARGHHRRYSSADMARLELMQHALLQGVAPAEAARYALSALPPDGAPDGAPAPGADAMTAPPRPEIGPEPPAPGRHARPPQSPEPPPGTPDPGRHARDGEAAVPTAPVEDGGRDDRPVRAGGGTLRMPGAGGRARGLGRAPVAVRELLEEAIDADGLVATWEDVARPVLGAVGQRWAATGRGIEVEHLLSECLLAVLNTRIAASTRGRSGTPGSVVLGAAPPAPSRPVLLAGMPDEMHVVPAAVLTALLTDRGVACRWLGPSLPAPALGAAVRRTAPAAVVLWSMLSATADPAVLAGLPVTRPRFRAYAAGPGWAGVELPSGVTRLTSLSGAGEQVAAAVQR
jgi:MerR family transcriptional regulator, light-induced transcriptional regulator